MVYQAGKKRTKRYKPNYIYTIISIALVLYLLGMLGLIVIHAQNLSDYFKENIEISIILQENAQKGDILKLQKLLETKRYTKSTEFVSKKEAAQQLKKKIDKDFLDLLGYNPLYSSINVHLNAEYANPDSLQWVETGMAQHKEVQEVYYQKSLVHLIHENVRTIGAVIIGLTALLLLIVLALINNTIRLSMYSNRFLIKSMQLVGASWGFITRPFVRKGILNGLISGGVAILALVGTLYYAQQNLPELLILQDFTMFGVLFGIILLIGVIISWVSTYFTVRKYLKMRLEDLY